ncbi:MAG TPA: hypothetical protein VFZ09_51270 [Archangium sp.]|uniref:hypothetical protein n=1 Tax=Archangium sp. TaxID=1872627 RepID=UPI002E334C4E|nr:hypothetical protein [Archangium sp.]HEX5754669.1 hypothetical protein [Archangium sp.]
MHALPSLRRSSLLLLALVLLGVPGQARAQATGGSNFAWYFISGCEREAYGAIANYDTARAQVDQALRDMYGRGQRRLRIPIYHGRGLNTGTVMDSTGGDLSPRHRGNLQGLLAAARSIGFAEIMVGFFPIGPNAPTQWTGWNEDLYQENWNLIVNLRPIIAASGIHYRMDLLNEGTPTPTQSVLLQYTRRLWSNYTSVFGKNDTLGFSIIGSEPGRISQIPQVYGGNLPYLFSLHFYENASQHFVNAHNQMNQLGLSQGWIIGEALYNDGTSASQLRSAINATGRTVFYLAQWPVRLPATCASPSAGLGVNVAPPVDYNVYLGYGF